jgi:LysM repeat protein
MTYSSNASQESTTSESSLGAIDRIARALESAGLDAPSSLYDEALSFAKQGLLGAARDRLRMLLCLDPDDGEAHLLLAKVFVAQQNWSEALIQLDAARAARVHVPQKIQDEVEAAIADERNVQEAQSQRQASREQAELQSLRMETRHLRAENTRLEKEQADHGRRIYIWAGVAGGLATVSLVLLGLLLHAGGPALGNEAVETPTAPTLATTEAPARPAEAAAPSSSSTTVVPTFSEAPSTTPVVRTPPEVEPAPKVVKAAPPKVVKATQPKAGSGDTKQDKKSKAQKAAPKATATSYLVKSGDTLSGLALRFYGDASKWTRIRNANRDHIGPNNSLIPNTRIVIP